MTIAEAVNELLINAPFLEEALADDLINVSSLARKLKPDIEEKLKKPVKEGAIVMAINRRAPNYYFKINRGIKNFMSHLGDVIVRSDLRDYTFENSPTLMKCQTRLMEIVSKEKELFCTFSQGVHESTIIISKSLEDKVAEIFRNEKVLAEKDNMSSITIKLPKNNVEISGVYYFILKKLAWDGINILEVISTTNEFTLVVSDDQVHKVFAILMNLKREKVVI